MFLEKLNRDRLLPTSASSLTYSILKRGLEEWRGFIERLRSPRPLDSDFFIVYLDQDQLTYLDEVSWRDGNIGGRDFLRQCPHSVNEEVAAASVIDFGFLENGFYRGGQWLYDAYLKDELENPCRNCVFTSELDAPAEVYDHFLKVAEHDPIADSCIGQISPDALYRMPFKFDFYSAEMFCAVGYAVAYNNLRYINAAAAAGVHFPSCRSYDNVGLTHLAVQFGTSSALRSVISHGSLIDDLDARGYTPLETAVHMKKIDCVDCLLSHNATPDYGLDKGATEVEHALTLCELSLGMYERLKFAKARFDVRQSTLLSTPLHCNAHRFRRDTFVAMVKDGLDPYAEDCDGATPFDRLRKDTPREIFDQVYRQCRRK